jgi:hypothetical protein
VAEKPAFASHEFGQYTTEALAKAGTVRLPCPPPALGTLYLGIPASSDRRRNPDLPAVPLQYFLRLVQDVSQNLVITRIIDLKELRGVSLPVVPTPKDGPSRVFKTVNDITDEITNAISALTKADKADSKKRGEYEVLLFEKAVIYVPESAPVLLRGRYEIGVSAAEAAEYADYLMREQCICPMDPRHHRFPVCAES